MGARARVRAHTHTLKQIYIWSASKQFKRLKMKSIRLCGRRHSSQGCAPWICEFKLLLNSVFNFHYFQTLYKMFQNRPPMLSTHLGGPKITCALPDYLPSGWKWRTGVLEWVIITGNLGVCTSRPACHYNSIKPISLLRIRISHL